jgi:hypothetical protein
MRGCGPNNSQRGLPVGEMVMYAVLVYVIYHYAVTG